MRDLLPFPGAVGPEPPPPEPPAADALLPTLTWPGSPERVALYGRRAALRLPLFVRGDLTVRDLAADLGYLPGDGRGNDHGGAVVRERGAALEVLAVFPPDGGRHRPGQVLVRPSHWRAQDAEEAA